MPAERPDRQIIPAHTPDFLPYDLEGPLQPEISWRPVSYDRARGVGSYLMRLQPGARTIPHEHPGFEDFLILEGELTDSDGRVRFRLRPGGMWLVKAVHMVPAPAGALTCAQRRCGEPSVTKRFLGIGSSL